MIIVLMSVEKGYNAGNAQKHVYAMQSAKNAESYIPIITSSQGGNT